MATLCFVQPVSDADEIQVHASARPGNTKASTDWGIRVWSEWAASRVTADAHREGVVLVTTVLLEMPSADLAYWMGKLVLEVRKKDGKEYLSKYLYALVCCFKCYKYLHALVCCFKCYYEQKDVNPSRC